MTDIFVSYVEHDREKAQAIASALTECGWHVRAGRHTGAWSQDSIRRATFEQIRSAKIVVVLFSSNAITAPSIHEEITIAQVQGIAIVRVSIEEVTPSQVLGTEIAANLASWGGDRDDAEFQRLREHVAQQLLMWHRHDQAEPKPPAARQDLFLCYRRADAQGEAGRLYDRLRDAYGAERVFMDIDSVPVGTDFVDFVTKEISRCRAVIVLIGRQWLKIKDKHRHRRLDDPEDLVRSEIAEALRQNITVMPVLVQDAPMPAAADLPEDVRLLARRNGISLRHEQWRDGVERLLKELDRVMERKP